MTDIITSQTLKSFCMYKVIVIHINYKIVIAMTGGKFYELNCNVFAK